MTIDHLNFHAQEQPQSIAVIDGDRQIRYGEFARDLRKFVKAVAGFRLARGSSVAIGCDDCYLHWLLVLACEHLGLPSASFHALEGRQSHSLLGSVDLVLAEPHYPPGGWNTKPITRAWAAEILADADPGPVPGAPKSPDDVLRIIRTSGTTGEAKRLALLRRMSEVRQNRLLWLYRRLSGSSRYLHTVPWSIGATYTSATWVLRSGGAIIFAGSAGMADIPALIQRHQVTHVSLLPVQLAQILDQLPPDWVRQGELEISTFGSAVPERLRQAAFERLAGVITALYGSNETSMIAVTRQAGAEGFGTICPDVAVEIVDEADRPVPDGMPGEIRIRSASVFDTYLDDRSLSRRMLRNGWFYPGDLGIRAGARLAVIGRSDDQVNLGGVKYGFNRIEEAVRQAGDAAIRDAGVASIPNESGLAEIHIAIVTEGSDDRALLDRLVTQLRPMIVGNLHFIRLPLIARNEMGKIDRAQLAQAILAAHQS